MLKSIGSSRTTLALLVLLVLFVAAAFDGVVGTEAWYYNVAVSSDHYVEAGTLGIEIEEISWMGELSGIRPGETTVLRFRVKSTGTLPLHYDIHYALSGELLSGPTPCYVSELRISDGVASLSAIDGDNPWDIVEIYITMPYDAGPEYEDRTGFVEITVQARQQ